jgi:S1/P1 Nuclease
MLYRICVFAILGFFFSSAPAWSWSGKGHRIVGAIADEVLKKSPTTKAKVTEILGGKTLATVSIWADCAKGFTYCHRAPSQEEQAYASKNPEHHNFHYADIPYQESAYVDASAGSAKYDAVHVISYAVAVLRGNAPANDSINLTQREALWVLAHVVGDIHQPLHVAALYYDKDCHDVVDPNIVGAGMPNFGIGTSVSETTGGNDLTKGSNNLHHYWDDNFVDKAMKSVGFTANATAKFVTYVVKHPPQNWQTSGDPETWSAKWASEIMPTGRFAYEGVRLGQAKHPDEVQPTRLKCTAEVTFEPNYEPDAAKVALRQVGKAGFRLAALLTAVFESQ